MELITQLFSAVTATNPPTSPVNLVISLLAVLLTAFFTQSKHFPWITTNHVKTIQALMVIVSVLTGLAHAASQPGGLASHDWPTTLRTLYDNALVVWLQIVALYVGVVKPLLKQSQDKQTVPGEQ